MTDNIPMQIMMRLRQIVQQLSRRSKNILENYRITIPQLLCLNQVYEHGPITIGALTRLVYLNSSTLTGIVDRLEKQNLVRRTRISKDRRQIHVEITDVGLEFIKNAPNPIQEGFLERLESLEEDKVTLLLWALELLVDMLGTDSRTGIRPASHILADSVSTEQPDGLSL